MFNNQTLDVVIGLVFIFLIYSLLATAVQEAISTAIHRRANTLYDGIRSMLTKTSEDRGIIINLLKYLSSDIYENFVNFLKKLFTGKKSQAIYDRFYDNQIIKNYGQNLFFKKPSYLTAENFSSILMETINGLDKNYAGRIVTMASLKAVLDNPATNKDIDPETVKILSFHMNEAAGDLNVFKFRLEKWYNDTMDRVSGWYKRNTQFYLFFIGIFIAACLNIDSIELAKYLSDNKAAREQLARMGEAAASNQIYSPKDSVIAHEALDSIKANINRAGTLIGLGWGDYGSSDVMFAKSEIGDTTSCIYLAFKSNKEKAASLYGMQLKQARSLLSPDASKWSAVDKTNIDSLTIHKNEIIRAKQFALLYSNDKYSSGLERRYVLFRLNSWKKLFGIIITAMAIGIGAPFWFDLLNKVVSLRTAVKTVNSSGSTTDNNASGGKNDIDG
jgi:hypothetical protein